VEGGAGRDGFRPVDLSALVERIRQAYEPAAEDEGRTLAANIQPGVAVAGDEELLAQLVSNLIENAFTHAVGSQVIDLELGAEGARACLAVRDRGPGVPQDQREKVLRRFYRLDRSRTTPGAGLGLAMAQAIAQLHGGEIELGDNRPGLVARVSLVRLTERRLEKG
jgi:signal transduction histidine kinase